MSRDSQLTADTPTWSPHFIDIAAVRSTLSDPGLLEAELRRIGLRPQALAAPFERPDHIGWHVHFGALAARVERLMLDPARDGESAVVSLRVQPDPVSGSQDGAADWRELFKLAVLLIDVTGGQRFYWSPADLWSDAAAFRAAVAEMLDSGMPPVLHLVAFFDDPDKRTTETRGLAHFCGQELSLFASAGLDRVARMRRLVRLAVDMMLNGRIAKARRFPGLTAGEFIEVAPGAATSGGAQIVHVLMIGT